MFDMRVICVSSLLLAVACDGPMLSAGSYLLEPDASSVSDARVDDDDDDDDDADPDPADARVEGDAGRSRDGGRNDGGDWRYPNEERHRCSNSDQCADNFFNRICGQYAGTGSGMCVECTDNQDCERFGPRFRCNEMVGFCGDPDRPRP